MADLVSSLLPYDVHARAQAARLDDLADDLRRRAAAVAARAAACRWDGTAARAFRRRADEDLRHVRRAAELLGEAGDALRVHGALVEGALRAEAAARAARVREAAERLDRVLHPGHGP